MNPEPSDLIWLQMTVEMRQQVIAVLIQMLLHWLAARPEVRDERGE